LNRFLSTRWVITYIIILFVAVAIALLIMVQTNDHKIIVNKNPNPYDDLKPSFSTKVMNVERTQQLLAIPELSADVRKLLTALNNYVIPQNKVFSFEEWMDEQNVSVSEKAQSAVAGMIYEVAVRTAMETGERYTHLILPKFSLPGFDVEIRKGQKNLSIRNPYRYSLQIRLGVNDSLEIFTNAERSTFPKISIENKALPFERVLLADRRGSGTNLPQGGINGAVVKVFSVAENGEKQLVSRDYYPAQAQVVLKGAASETAPEEME
jgi:hypothetical protein